MTMVTWLTGMKRASILSICLFLTGLAYSQSAFDGTPDGRQHFATSEQHIFDDSQFKGIVTVKANGVIRDRLLYSIPRLAEYKTLSDGMVKLLQQRILDQAQDYRRAGFSYVTIVQVTSSNGRAYDGLRVHFIYHLGQNGLEDVTAAYIRGHGGVVKALLALCELGQ